MTDEELDDGRRRKNTVIRLATFAQLLEGVAYAITRGCDVNQLLQEMEDKHDEETPWKNPEEGRVFNDMYFAMKNVVKFSMNQDLDD
jgi:hypothetical protein